MHYNHLTREQRYAIYLGLQEGKSLKAIGRVKQQVQYYEINLKNSLFGVEKLSFSLGLRLILY